METPSGAVDHFDRYYGALDGLPDTIKTGASTIISSTPLLGLTQTFIVQTVRQKDVGDSIFVQYVDGAGSKRLVIPPRVAEAIARQRDALTDKSRSKAAKALAQERKARGEVPGFLRQRTKRGTKA